MLHRDMNVPTDSMILKLKGNGSAAPSLLAHQPHFDSRLLAEAFHENVSLTVGKSRPLISLMPPVLRRAIR